MSRRLALALGLLSIAGVALWFFRSGEEPSETGSKSAASGGEKRRQSAKAQRKGDRPMPHGRDEVAGAGPSERMRQRAPGAKPPKLGPNAFPDRPTPPELVNGGFDQEFADSDLNEAIRKATQDPDPEERASAIGDLALQEDMEPIIPVLKVAAGDPDSEVRLAVVAALGEFGADAVPMDLVNQLAQDSDPEVRIEVLGLLETWADDETWQQLRPLVARATRDSDEDVRDRADMIIYQNDETEDDESE